MQYDSLLIVKDIIVAIAAFVGMGLGFLNYWNEKIKEQVKLKVIPKAIKTKGRNSEGREFVITTVNGFNAKEASGLFAVEVVNMSKFTIVIEEVGFLAKGFVERMTVPNPRLGDNGNWPRKLEPRESVTIYGNLKDMFASHLSNNMYCAFAETSCGYTGTGSSKALEGFVEVAKQYK